MDADTNWPLGWPTNGYPEPLTAPHLLLRGRPVRVTVWVGMWMEGSPSGPVCTQGLYMGRDIGGTAVQWEYQVISIKHMI